MSYQVGRIGVHPNITRRQQPRANKSLPASAGTTTGSGPAGLLQPVPPRKVHTIRVRRARRGGGYIL